MRHPRAALLLVLLVAAFGVAAIAVVGTWRARLGDGSATDGGSHIAERGAPAPPIRLPLAEGGAADLAQQQGKVVLVNFWATWCQPCRAEMPALQRLADTLPAGSFALYPVNLQEGTPTVRPYLAEIAFTTPALLDEDGSVTRAYGVRALPASFLVDKQGVLRDQHLGPLLGGDAGTPWSEAWVERQVRAFILNPAQS